LSGSQRRRFFRHVVGFVFQNSGLIDSWTVDRNLRVPITQGGRTASQEDIKSALERVGATGLGSARVHTLSGGEQQRVALARLILKDPLLVLADEPMAALDADNADLVFRVLGQSARQGSIVLMATHDPATTKRCDRELRLPPRSSNEIERPRKNVAESVFRRLFGRR
jgi:putative ABC transport system ATP-binding protein